MQGQEPLVLLHGAASTGRAWKPVIHHLQQHHVVWAPTLAGHRGGTPVSAPEAEILDAIVDDMELQLDEHGYRRVHLAGNSLGGWVALELARRGRALSVVALSPAGAWALPRDLSKLLRLFRLGALAGSRRSVRALSAHPAARRVILGNVLARPERMPKEEVAAMFEDMLGCSVLLPMLEGAAAAGPIAPLAHLDIPVRIAWAAEDRTLPFENYGKPLLRSVPQAELVPLPGVGHVPMYDDPELVIRTILGITSPRTALASARSQHRSRVRQPSPR